MTAPKGIIKEELVTEELRIEDEQLTQNLKQMFSDYYFRINYSVQNLDPNHHVNVAFYIGGDVKIQTIKNGNSAKTFECISSVVLTPDRNIDEWVNYAIENRVYRL